MTASSTPALRASDLAPFTGSETVYRHPLNRRAVYTEGVQFLAERGGAYWLLDAILLVQPAEPALAACDFQVWTLSVAADRSAQLVCTDGNDGLVYQQSIAWTDFPLDRVQLWFANGVLYLPSEH